jgi:D-alanyl-D-alanine carboxypeptidase
MTTELAHAQPSPPASARLQGAIEEIARQDPTIPGVLAAVSAPRLGLEWQGAAGFVARRTPERLKPTDAFRIASVSKVAVAATVIRLIEQGRFGMYDSMAPLVSEATRNVLKSDGYDVDGTTVFHLMTHTSGIFDNSTSPDYLSAVAEDPKRVWTAQEQLEFTVRHGAPVAPAGRDYNYSEASYIILGEIIERQTGKSLGQAVSYELQLPARGLKTTYWEKMQRPPAGERRAHQYYGDVDLTTYDASYDLFGGGGLVSTVGDLVHFVRPLLKGEMFDKPTSLPMALIVPPTQNGRLAHAPLLAQMRFGKRMCWSHGGFYGIMMVYCPDIDVAVAIAWNQGRAEGTWQAATARLASAIEEIAEEDAQGRR